MKSLMPLFDDRVKYMKIGRFKAKMKAMKRPDYEAFKYSDEIWQIEEEAVLVPFYMWRLIQQAMVEGEMQP